MDKNTPTGPDNFFTDPSRFLHIFDTFFPYKISMSYPMVLRWFAVVLTLQGMAGSGWSKTPRQVKVDAINLLLPGENSIDPEDLDPRFLLKVSRVVKRLKKQGHSPVFGSTYRSPKRQDFIFTVSIYAALLGRQPATYVRGGFSCHNRRKNGKPAALAADIVPGDDLSLAQKARFYKALGKAARREGLIWGGAWKKSNPKWRDHGLGWDPAHIQSRRCR